MDSAENPYILLFRAASLIPISHYLWGFLSVFLIFLYNFLEIHLFEDILSGFRGSPVSLTFTPGSDIYEGIVSKCKVLHGRYLATWWLASPHLQTTFLNFHGRPPVFTYQRQIFHASDGGNVALDWLLKCDVSGDSCQTNNTISKDDTTPLVVVIPGLTSDSNSPYMKHLVFDMAKFGWNVVVGNHRGLGGTSITSDCFYNAGWTDDVRSIINFLHHEYPRSPLFAVGTSIGANILVKYLGEDGENVPVAGAVALCSPWDLLIGDRFINRRLHQKIYDKALTIGLQGYAHLHEAHYSRLADWEGIKKSRSIRDFDNYATCIVGKFETVDTYYRRCSSSSFVGNVSVPLLCISALDDPVCTREAIPWDECRVNKNIVLATTQHGGHLAFFEGMTASKLWWVRAVNEFLDILHSSPYMHKQKKVAIYCIVLSCGSDWSSNPITSLESSIDHGPFVNVGEDGLVAAIGNEHATNDLVDHALKGVNTRTVQDGPADEAKLNLHHNDTDIRSQPENMINAGASEMGSARRCLNRVSQTSRVSMWLLAYIAIMTSWPVLGSAVKMIFHKKFRGALPGASAKS